MSLTQSTILAIVVGAFLFALGVMAWISENNFIAASNREPQQPDTELKIFGSIPYWDQDKAVQVFKAHPGKFDIISLFWYRLDEQGNIVKYTDAREDLSIIDFARRNNVKVLALIANLPEEGE